MSPDKHAQDLHHILHEAGSVALRHFGQVARETKADGTPVTEADRECEQVIVDGLQRRFPHDGIEGEEGALVQAGERTWYVDPIDGTAAFLEGLAYWGPTAARVDRQGKIDLAALYLPRTRDYFSCSGGVASYGDRTLPDLVARPPAGGVLYVPSKLHLMFDLQWPGKTRCLGSTAAHLCLVAAGSARACVIGNGWNVWDVACGIGMLRATGGVAITVDGEELDVVRHRKTPFVAGDPAAVAWLRQPGRIKRKERQDV